MFYQLPPEEYNALVALSNSLGVERDPDAHWWSGVELIGVEVDWARQIVTKKGNVGWLSFQTGGFLRPGGSIPESIGALTKLLSLRITDWGLTGSIPKSIGALQNLQDLDLSGNELEGEIPTEIFQLRQLQRLWLPANRLSGSLPAELGNLKLLTDLILSGNNLSGFLPPAIGNLTSLTELHLGGNQLEGSIPDTLGMLTNLLQLDLSRNRLTGTIPNVFWGFKTLRFLGLSDNDLTGNLPESFGELTRLEHLRASSNDLSGPIPLSVGNLLNLQDLKLFGNKLSGEIPWTIGNLKQLEWLQLSGNEIAGSIPYEIGALTNLHFLLLDANRLSGPIPNSITNLISLRHMDISHNFLLDAVESKTWQLHRKSLPTVVTDLPQRELLITMHRLRDAALVNTNSASDTIQLRADPAGLRVQPEIHGGLVADGVTPLVLRLELPTVLAEEGGASVKVKIARISGGSMKQPLEDQFRVLRTRFFVPTNEIVFSAGQKEAFLVIQGMGADVVSLESDSQELKIELEFQLLGGPAPETFSFHIRKPPVVLVHGYNTKGDWGTAFLDELTKERPREFVRGVSYGVVQGDYTANVVGTLEELARMLHQTLKARVENENDSPFETDQSFANWGKEGTTAWKKDWAFTRYDVVAHSQGGVLVRMLCSHLPNRGIPPFRADANFLKGRFHRIVTIGSPHNGSRMVYYSLRLMKAYAGAGLLLPGMKNGFKIIPGLISRLLSQELQPKFDPFGVQIAELNELPNWIPDPSAPIHRVRATIASGEPFDSLSPLPASYFAMNLVGQDRARVLPSGSDGVVDFASQAGLAEGSGDNTFVSHVGADTQRDIAHSGPEAFYLFGADNDEATETASILVASYVRNLLLNKVTGKGFGPFNPSPPLGEFEKDQIDSAVRAPKILSVIERVFTSQRIVATETETYHFRLRPPVGWSPASLPFWTADAYGENGRSTLGLSIVTDPLDTSKVTIHVAPQVEGDVVLYALYTSSDGTQVISAPVLVQSYSGGDSLESLELEMPRAASVGSWLSPEIWGLYSNGKRRMLYIPPSEELVWSSSDPSVVDLSRFGRNEIRRPGEVEIAVLYRGLEVRRTLSAVSDGAPALHIQIAGSEKTLMLTGRPGRTYTLEVSNDLRSWSSVKSFVLEESGQWTTVVEGESRFFRVRAN